MKTRILSMAEAINEALRNEMRRNPEIILLDEPFSGLDPLVRDELIDALMARVRPRTLAGTEALASTPAARRSSPRVGTSARRWSL